MAGSVLSAGLVDKPTSQIAAGERRAFTCVPIEHTWERQGGPDLHWSVADLAGTKPDGAKVVLGPDPDGQRIVGDGGTALDAPRDWQKVSGAGLYALRGNESQFAGVIYGGSGGYGKDTWFHAHHPDLIPLG